MTTPMCPGPTAPGPRRSDGRLWKGIAALLAALLLGMSGWSTYAYWQDRASVSTGTFTAGKLDLRFDGENGTGVGTAYTASQITVSDLLPGETRAYALALNNGGNPRATYTITATQGSTWSLVGNPLQFQAFQGTPANAAGPPRTGACSGGQLNPAATITTGTATLVPSRTLTANGSETVCFVLTMVTAADNLNQGKSGVIALTVTATQVIA